MLDSADAVLDWLLPGPVNAPTDTPKQTQLDVELIVTYPPAKECDAVALAGSKYSQNVTPRNRFVHLPTFFLYEADEGFFPLCMYRDLRMLVHAKRV